jgi:hypothetical protein
MYGLDLTLPEVPHLKIFCLRTILKFTFHSNQKFWGPSFHKSRMFFFAILSHLKQTIPHPLDCNFIKCVFVCVFQGICEVAGGEGATATP